MTTINNCVSFNLTFFNGKCEVAVQFYCMGRWRNPPIKNGNPPIAGKRQMK